MGGEAMSLAIPYPGSKDFASVEHAPLIAEKGGICRQRRQFGNYSFSRVYQADHKCHITSR